VYLTEDGEAGGEGGGLAVEVGVGLELVEVEFIFFGLDWIIGVVVGVGGWWLQCLGNGVLKLPITVEWQNVLYHR